MVKPLPTINSSTCSWHPAGADRPPCTSPTALAGCLPRFSFCLGDFMHREAFPRPGQACLLPAAAGLKSPSRHRDVAVVKGKTPPPTRQGAGTRRVQHRGQPRSGTGGVQHGGQLPHALGQARVQHRGQLRCAPLRELQHHGQLHRSRSSYPLPPPSPRAEPFSCTPRCKGPFHWLPYSFIPLTRKTLHQRPPEQSLSEESSFEPPDLMHCTFSGVLPPLTVTYTMRL